MPKLSIAQWRAQARKKCGHIIGDTALEIDLIIKHVCQFNDVECITKQQDLLTNLQYQTLESLLHRRLQNEPIAYILGFAEFYGLNLFVDARTLIPRSDTEPMIDWLLANIRLKSSRILDLGTGSGAIAIALKTHLPQADVHAIDSDIQALEVAKKNANHHQLNIEFHHQNWLSDCHDQFDVIIANPPYIDENDGHLKALTFEPQHALIAQDHGLKDLKTIIAQAMPCLNNQGLLLLEHGESQAIDVMRALQLQGFDAIENHVDWQSKPRFCSAIKWVNC